MKQLIFILLAMIGVSQAQTIQYIGAPTTTVISRGNFRTDSIFYLPKRTKLPTDTAALRYQISDSSLYAWTGSQWRKVGADADTLIYSTRAWRQKGDDSLAARINLKVNISDTASMLTPYLRKADTTAMLSPYYRSATASAALALKLNISDTSSMLGNYVRHAGYGLTKSGQSFLVDTLNIATRAWRQKGIDSVAGLSRVGGSGTTNTVAKFTASGTIGNSSIFDNGSVITTSNPFVINPATAGASYQQYKYGGTDVALLGTDASISGGSAGDFGIYTYGASNLDFWTSGSRRLRITSGGDVGVGTTSPNIYSLGALKYLTVSNNAGGGYSVFTVAGGAGGGAEIDFGNQTIRHAAIATLDGSNFGIYTNNTNSGTGVTERLRIFANGRVFIGASPTDAGYQLDVNGSIRSTTTIRSDGNFYNESASPIYTAQLNTAAGQRILMQMSGTDGELKVTRASGTQPNLIFSTEGGEKMRITSAGNVGINQNSPSYQLDINGTLRSVNGANFATTSGQVGIGTASPQQILHANATTGAYIQLSRTAQGGTTSPFGGIYFGDGTTFQEAAILSGADGNVVSGNMAFYTRAAAGSLLEGFRVNSTQEMLVGGGSDAGDYKLQVAGNIYTTGNIQMTGSAAIRNTVSQFIDYGTGGSGDLYIRGGSGFANVLTATNAGEVLVNTTTDAGDYKLQVVGNARVGTGKLDIASNTTFGIGVARSGTSEVAGQIYNSNGILYLGAESSAGGQIFSGSSAYAAVIGSGAAYPLQFAVNNTTFATMNTNGRLLINTTFDNGAYPLQVAGSVYNTGQATRGVINTIGTNASITTDSTQNIPAISVNQSLTGTSAQPMITGAVTWNTSGSPNAINVDVVNTASGANANFIRISDGSNIFRVTKAAEVVTAAPTGGSIRKWKLGEAATVSPTSPNRTIRVEIDGTVYYLHAKTTND